MNLGRGYDFSSLPWLSFRRQAWSSFHRPLLETPLSVRLIVAPVKEELHVLMLLWGTLTKPSLYGSHSPGQVVEGGWVGKQGGHWEWREPIQKVLANQCLILFELEGIGHFWSEGILDFLLFMERVQKRNQGEEKSEWVCCEVKSSVTFVTG